MTTCVENLSCLPKTPMEVFKIFDVEYGTGMTTVVLAGIVATVILCIYLRTKNMPMLTVLGIYAMASFGSLITSSYVSAQYNIAVWIIIMTAASVLLSMVLKLVKE